MKGKAAIYKNLAAFGIVVGMWVLFALMTTGMGTLLEGLTAVVFITVIALLAEDAMEKAFTDTSKLTWQYLMLAVFVIIVDGLWLFLAACDTWLQLALRAIVLAAGAAGTVCWYLFFYQASVMSDDERLVKMLTKAYRKAAKAFPQLDDEGVRNALKETLFCRLEGDRLEGDLLADQPLVPGFRTYNETADSVDLPASEKSAAMTNIASYINVLIARRNSEANASR